MVWLRDNLPADAIICNGAGNYAAWIHRFFRMRRFGQHVAPTAGSMGFGVPAAVAMKRLYPERPIVCVAGDGDFLMNGQEFATAVQYDLPFIIIINDNGLYGTIRMHQEREYPGRISATALAQSGFCRIRARLRRLRNFGRAHRGFPCGVHGGAGVRQAGHHPPEDRSRSDHAGNDASENPGEGGGGEGSLSGRIEPASVPGKRV